MRLPLSREDLGVNPRQGGFVLNVGKGMVPPPCKYERFVLGEPT
jgi:hypothetical protein